MAVVAEAALVQLVAMLAQDFQVLEEQDFHHQ
jgi:hypothetical protein